MMVQDMRSYLPDDILYKVDRAAMGIGLETRIPFLDPGVIDLAARLPMRMKVNGGVGKWALRQILYRHVPKELIERPKAGFGVPVGSWLRGPLRDWGNDLLSEDRLNDGDLLDPAPIRRAWAEHLSGRRDWTNRLWTILMLQTSRDYRTQVLVRISQRCRRRPRVLPVGCVSSSCCPRSP
jgi:asparagine synthase (glutamine-hydrolysing)